MAIRARPVYLNPLRIHAPVTAVISFAHRITGLLMFLAIPIVVALLDLSLRDADGYGRVAAALDTRLFRIAAVLLAWALAHHLFAGIRFLLIDVGAGVERAGARLGAWIVTAAGAVVLIVAAGMLLL